MTVRRLRVDVETEAGSCLAASSPPQSDRCDTKCRLVRQMSIKGYTSGGEILRVSFGLYFLDYLVGLHQASVVLALH